MIANRELTMDDYLAILRRRLKVILLPLLLMPIVGFLVSFIVPPKYTSQSAVVVDTQKVPQSVVKSEIAQDVMQRVATLQQQVLSRTRLQGLVERLHLAKNGKTADDVVDDIRSNVTVEPVDPATIYGKKWKPGQNSDVPGFNVNVTYNNPRDAQSVCSEITSMLLEEDLRQREIMGSSTTDFLARQLDGAKHDLDTLDSRLATFKKQYIGQLPGDTDNNMRILMGLNSQLDANTQTLNRAEQDKAYTESMLAQQLAAWKSAQNVTTTPQTLEQQLAQLQSQLMSLQARYTEDYPDVVKTKADIAEVKRQLKEINAASSNAVDTTQKAGAAEPPEIQQLRTQIHQYDDAITQATRDQRRLQDQIKTYEGRVSLSPAVEEQYKQLTRDYETAQKIYNDLLAKKSQSEMSEDLERRQQGAQMRLLNPAGLPDSPSFPNRLLFAGGGVGGGLAIGFGLALWLELRDKSIRTEQDVIAVLDLPMLVSVPWITEEANEKQSQPRFRPRPKAAAEDERETVEV